MNSLLKSKKGRLSAVYGAVFVLARSAQSLIIEDNKCVGIETNKEKITADHIVSSWDHLPNYVLNEPESFK